MKRRRRTNVTSTKIRPVVPEKKPQINFHPLSAPRSGKRLSLYIIFLFVIIAGGSTYLYFLSQDLPSLTKLENIDPALATKVYSEDGELIESFHLKNRTITPFNKFPDELIQCLLATEDRRFFDHWGVNILGVFRSVYVNLTNFAIVEGSSTLTMQLARNLYLSPERTWSRKIKEVLTTIQIERTYSKKEIIEMYLNIMFFGSNAYGIQAAAKKYYSKNVEDLKLEEYAVLIGILNAPTRYNPLNNPDRAIKRCNDVLKNMVETGYLKKLQYDSLSALPLKLNPTSEDDNISPYFTEFVRQHLNSLQDSLDVNVYEDGLRVYTTLNTKIQRLMNEAIEKKIPFLQDRLRHKPEMIRLKKELSDSLSSDSLFEEMTTVQIAFVCLDPSNGHILGMVGGRDFRKYKFNRATQAPRQPGSAFKPFVYTAAIDNGYNPADEFLNQPFVEINDDGTRWTPHNYDNTVSGFMSLREALRGSKNLVSIRLIREITPRLVAEYAKRMGITTPMRPVSSLALGTSEIKPIELVAAFGVFSNNGVYVKPIAITKIEDKTGNIIFVNRSVGREVLSPETTQIMNDMLQDVVNKGTGYAARRDYKFFEPAGGKTGTTNDYTDAWFVGFTAHMAAGVWVGFDDPGLSLGSGETGAIAALPFWASFMTAVYDSLDFPTKKFAESPNVIRATICKDTRKLATSYCPETIEEMFNLKFMPTEKCEEHGGPNTVKKERRKRF
jgi:penicillin-binding protein 1A